MYKGDFILNLTILKYHTHLH